MPSQAGSGLESIARRPRSDSRSLYEDTRAKSSKAPQRYATLREMPKLVIPTPSPFAYLRETSPLCGLLRSRAPFRSALLGLCFCTLLSCSEDTSAGQKESPEATQASQDSQSNASTAPESPSQTAPSDPDLQACEDMPGHTRCVWPLPPGWSGPILPQAAQQATALGTCTSPLSGDSNNAYISKFNTQPGACKGCEVELELGSCTQAKLAERKVNPDAPSTCMDFSEKDGGVAVGNSCQRISGEQARAGELAIGLRAGTPTLQEAECKVIKEASMDPGSVQTLEVQRICAGQDLSQASCSNQRSCMAFDIDSADDKDAPILDKVCIFKEGDQECPKLNYTDKTLIHQGIKDQRSCGPCQVKHEKGELRCIHEIGLNARDRDRECQDPTPVDIDDLCLTEEDFLSPKAPWSLIETRREVIYSGRCETGESKVVGEIKFEKTLTLCCRNTWE